MNEQLNSAIAFLEGKYGWKTTLRPNCYVIGEYPYCINSPYIRVEHDDSLGITGVSYNAKESDILDLAKSAGWTGEEWEPKEGDRVIIVWANEQTMYHCKYLPVRHSVLHKDGLIFPDTPAGLAQAKKKAGIKVDAS